MHQSCNGRSGGFGEPALGLGANRLAGAHLRAGAAFVYLALAAQVESFRNPFIIMLTVPLSVTVALAVLLLTRSTPNVYSQIGLVTLVGLITKHGILIVEFANQLQEKGEQVMQAVIDVSVLRLRPILMTTGATVLGALSLALASGAGAESRQQIGWVIVGGLLFGTLLTLFVVPIVYSLIARGGPAQRLEEAESAARELAPAGGGHYLIAARQSGDRGLPLSQWQKAGSDPLFQYPLPLTSHLMGRFSRKPATPCRSEATSA